MCRRMWLSGGYSHCMFIEKDVMHESTSAKDLNFLQAAHQTTSGAPLNLSRAHLVGLSI